MYFGRLLYEHRTWSPQLQPYFLLRFGTYDRVLFCRYVGRALTELLVLDMLVSGFGVGIEA
jgi:hypothetical protein